MKYPSKNGQNTGRSNNLLTVANSARITAYVILFLKKEIKSELWKNTKN